MQKLILALCLFFVLFSCKDKNDDPKKSSTTEYPSVAVTKSVTNKKIFVHLMPWFETKSTSDNGKWGIHWTMNAKNPDNIVDEASGRRDIASHYYPLIGPYASGDPDVIEYQLLLMKLSGIDGVLIDWYSTIDLYDYPLLLKNVERFIALTEKVGLQYAIVYEDQTINNAFSANKITDKVAAAQKDMEYIEKKYFKASNYIKIDDKPLLMTFGPQTFKTPGEWTNIFSAFTAKPKFLTLWYQSAQAGANADGEYSWVYQDDKSHWTHLDNFYNRSFAGMKMGSAYPGFKDFYAEGGWGNNLFTIDHEDGQTLKLSLEKGINSNAEYIQLVTWNDYGEGTMLEPTVEFGYKFLTTIQTVLGVQNNQEDLELVNTLFQLRKEFKTDDAIQTKLDQVFYDIVSLKLTEAKSLIQDIQK